MLDDVKASVRAKLNAGLKLAGPSRNSLEADYTAWLTHYYPKAVSKPMAFYHREFWDWLWELELDKPHPEFDAFFGIWPRRCGKTTSGQLAIAVVGAKKLRRYCWLLSRTQAQANQKLLTVRQAIGRMGSDFLRDYPHMAKAKTEDGYNLGWSTMRLVCSDGGEIDFIVEAIGLDMAVRGANLEFVRPDFIMPDDIDALHDSRHVVEKNIETLTKSVLLAGTNDKVVLGLQNLIHRDSIFSQIADGRAKFLMNRYTSGPVSALAGDFKYEERMTEKGSRFVILSGVPTWPEGFGLPECEKELNDVGPEAFEGECQHNVTLAHGDATFREFDPVYHCITVSEFMRFFVGNRAMTYGLQRFDMPFTDGLAARLALPRGECAMAEDWGSSIKHPCANRWLWRPGEGVPLSDSVFFVREMCWPTYPPISNDPRSDPSYGQLHPAILAVEKSLGIASSWKQDAMSIQFRLMSHERPEAATAYWKDHKGHEPLSFQQIDTKEAKEGILHLQELQHIDKTMYHPFRVDPRTIDSVPSHLCRICGWHHDGEHLRGKPRAFYVVADGQGELIEDKLGKLACLPALDEMGQARTRFEYPRHQPRETADGEEKTAAKRDDDIIDTDRALVGRVFYMIKRLSADEQIKLKYQEIFEGVQYGVYADGAARETAYMSAGLHYAEQQAKAERENLSWAARLDGWEQ